MLCIEPLIGRWCDNLRQFLYSKIKSSVVRLVVRSDVGGGSGPKRGDLRQGAGDRDEESSPHQQHDVLRLQGPDLRGPRPPGPAEPRPSRCGAGFAEQLVRLGLRVVVPFAEPVQRAERGGQEGEGAAESGR